jgi:hypothetical protein
VIFFIDLFPPHEITLSELNGAACASDQDPLPMLAIISVYFGAEDLSTPSGLLLVQSC